MSAISDETATELMGPNCEHCGWRQALDKQPRHRPAVPTMGVEACPKWTPPPVEEKSEQEGCEVGAEGCPEGEAKR